jgi:hypothetical protein
MTRDAGLVGHWPLRGDCRDHSGYENHGSPGGADLAAPGRDGAPGGAAGFDGASAGIAVAGGESLRPGAGDFSVAVWVHTDQDAGGALGDVVCKYDPASRRGFNLGLMTYTGVTSHQPNTRNLHFGVDGGADDPRWRDCGRPGNAVMVKALAVHAGDLYAATFEAGAGEAGHVYRHTGGTQWEDCGAPGRCNAVAALAVHQGMLWAGVSRYRAQGSALPESPNRRPGGRVYRYAGGREWVDQGKLDAGDRVARAGADERSPYRSPVCDSVAAMAVHRGALYAIPLYSEGLFRHDGHDGGTAWTFCGTPGRRLMALAVFGGHLYAAGNEGGGVFRYGGGEGAAARWVPCGVPAGASQVYSFAVYGGRLHAGTWPEGRVFRYDGGEGVAARWRDCGRLGGELEVMGMLAYNGQLYAGTLPLAEVYRYAGGATWERTGRLDWTPDVRYRRAWSMAVYQGQLFCGTLPSGRVFALRAGLSVTHDHELPPGWRHLAAVREAGRLRLYVDGQLVAASRRPGPSALDVSNDRPLTIGSGPHAPLRGRLADLRVYRRALSEEDVAALAAVS